MSIIDIILFSQEVQDIKNIPSPSIQGESLTLMTLPPGGSIVLF